MDTFIKNCLKPILNDDVDDEIIQYIKDIKVVEDFEEFIDNIMDKRNPEHAEMYEKLKVSLFGTNKRQTPTSSASSANTKKQPQNRAPAEAFPSLLLGRNEFVQQKSSSKTPKQANSMFSDTVTNKDVAAFNYNTPSSKKEGVGGQSEQVHSGGKGKKSKFVNIESFDSTIGLKKGRHPCNCEARIHALINNCLKCGRIVCEQEGSGPCFFCDSMVCTNDELRILESNSKQSDKLYNRLKEQKTSKEWKKAIETRDRLIKADQSGEYKRQIYDDQTDYYGGNKGKGKSSKNNDVFTRIHKSRKDMKLALDFASRMVVSTEDEFVKRKEYLMKAVNKLLDTTEERFPKNVFEVKNEVENSNSNKEKNETADQSGEDKTAVFVPSKFNKIKVANDAFLTEIDRGMCLTMHQPWASLLVAGIKMHEGRTWYTEHRGRLWIHAASREPESNEILEVEKMYCSLYNDPDLVFPRKYPTGCLLGCVFVEDCLGQEKYREMYTQGESDSPYVLICNSPMILPIFYQMQGQHKIFPLSKEVHKKAQEALLSSKWL